MEDIRRENALNLPNLLTMLRIGLLPAIIWRFRRGDSFGALVLYLIAMLTDLLDGLIARRYNQITALGKLLDPVADKLSLITLLWLFVADGQVSSWVLWLILGKELLLVICSMAVLQRGIVVYALPIGKVTTLAFVLSIVVRFLEFERAADGLLLIAIALSFASLGWYMAAGAEKLKWNHPA